MTKLYYGRPLFVVWDTEGRVLEGLIAGPTEMPYDDARRLFDQAFAAVVRAYPDSWDFTDVFDHLEEKGFKRVDHEEWSEP